MKLFLKVMIEVMFQCVREISGTSNLKHVRKPVCLRGEISPWWMGKQWKPHPVAQQKWGHGIIILRFLYLNKWIHKPNIETLGWGNINFSRQIAGFSLPPIHWFKWAARFFFFLNRKETDFSSVHQSESGSICILDYRVVYLYGVLDADQTTRSWLHTIFWHFWTFHVKRMFQENSPVHINVCRLDALVELEGFFSFSQSFLRHSTLLMHGSHILCSTSCPRLQKKKNKKKHIFGLYQPWNIIRHPEAVLNWIMGRTCDVPIYFQMFSSGKRSHSAGLIPSDANLSLAICSSFRLLSDSL